MRFHEQHISFGNRQTFIVNINTDLKDIAKAYWSIRSMAAELIVNAIKRVDLKVGVIYHLPVKLNTFFDDNNGNAILMASMAWEDFNYELVRRGYGVTFIDHTYYDFIDHRNDSTSSFQLYKLENGYKRYDGNESIFKDVDMIP